MRLGNNTTSPSTEQCRLGDISFIFFQFYIPNMAYPQDILDSIYFIVPILRTKESPPTGMREDLKEPESFVPLRIGGEERIIQEALLN